MKLSKLSFAVIAATCAMAGVAQAKVTNTGSVAFTTDYKFRGISQTTNNAAVQGSLTLNHDSGAYFTAWGSSIAAANGGLELDTLLGYAGSSGDIGYDVGVMRYNYPGNDGGQAANNGRKRFSYNEAYASVSMMGAKVGGAVSDDYFGDSGSFHYLYADYSKEVFQGFGVVAHVGYNKFGSAAGMNRALGTSSTGENSYVDYKAGITKSIEGIGFELAYIGTDIKRTDLLDGNGAQSNIGQGEAVLTATKSF